MAIKHTFQSAKVEGGDATLVGPNEWNDAHSVTSLIPGGVTNASVTTTFNIDASLGNVWILTLIGAVTISISNPTLYQEITLVIVQDATGGRAVTWPASFIDPVVIDATTPANQVTIQKFVYDGTNWRTTSPAQIS